MGFTEAGIRHAGSRRDLFFNRNHAPSAIFGQGAGRPHPSLQTDTGATGIANFDVGLDLSGNHTVLIVTTPSNRTTFQGNGLILQSTSISAAATVNWQMSLHTA